MKNFELLKSGIEVSGFSEILNKHPTLWNMETGRQDYPGSAHRETKCIILRGPKIKTQEGLQGNHGVINYPYMVPFYKPVISFLEIIKDMGLGSVDVGMIMLTKLPPGGQIYMHVDEGAYAENYQRYHLVIQSGGEDSFQCEDEIVEMQTGELWRFNHKGRHGCVNDGTEDRIHLIIDLKD